MNQELWENWQVAEIDLQLEIVVPFSLEIGSHVVRADFLVKNFGGSPGTLVVQKYDDLKSYQNEIVKAGYGFSVLQPQRKDGYDRDTFISMLSEWGWTGNVSKTPVWLRDVED